MYLNILGTALGIVLLLSSFALLAFLLAGISEAMQAQGRARILLIATVVIVFATGAAVLWLIDVFGKAAIEFVRVVIDVEGNTREIAGRLHASNDLKG